MRACLPDMRTFAAGDKQSFLTEHSKNVAVTLRLESSGRAQMIITPTSTQSLLHVEPLPRWPPVENGSVLENMVVKLRDEFGAAVIADSGEAMVHIDGLGERISAPIASNGNATFTAATLRLPPSAFQSMASSVDGVCVEVKMSVQAEGNLADVPPVLRYIYVRPSDRPATLLLNVDGVSLSAGAEGGVDPCVEVSRTAGSSLSLSVRVANEVGQLLPLPFPPSTVVTVDGKLLNAEARDHFEACGELPQHKVSSSVADGPRAISIELCMPTVSHGERPTRGSQHTRDQSTVVRTLLRVTSVAAPPVRWSLVRSAVQPTSKARHKGGRGSATASSVDAATPLRVVNEEPLSQVFSTTLVDAYGNPCALDKLPITASPQLRIFSDTLQETYPRTEWPRLTRYLGVRFELLTAPARARNHGATHLRLPPAGAPRSTMGHRSTRWSRAARRAAVRKVRPSAARQRRRRRRAFSTSATCASWDPGGVAGRSPSRLTTRLA